MKLREKFNVVVKKHNKIAEEIKETITKQQEFSYVCLDKISAVIKEIFDEQDGNEELIKKLQDENYELRKRLEVTNG